jgi:hypothetical protein
VHHTTAAQKRLLRAVKDAQSAAATVGSQATVYRTVPGGTVYAPASSSVPAPTPAPVSAPPTTRTS